VPNLKQKIVDFSDLTVSLVSSQLGSLSLIDLNISVTNRDVAYQVERFIAASAALVYISVKICIVWRRATF
jgi:hypothetical protein